MVLKGGLKPWFLPAATKLGQGNVFYRRLWFCPQGGSASVHAGMPDPPQTRHPPGPDPPRPDTPHTPHWTREQTPPPREADAGIRSMRGRYASYWNAFLYNVRFRCDLFTVLFSVWTHRDVWVTSRTNTSGTLHVPIVRITLACKL